MTEKPLAFLSLIKTLESTVGHTTSYALLDPFPCITSEYGKPALIPIQHAGKTIARHVGLDNLTFIISLTTLDPSTAGHIELRYGDPAVFVEISTGICTFKDAVLATLCHEVSHKFLHVHGIRHVYRQKWAPIETMAAHSNTSDAEIIECPVDRTKLRVPWGKKRLRVMCSVCKYKFIVNTASGEVPAGPTKPGLLKSLKAAFGRR